MAPFSSIETMAFALALCEHSFCDTLLDFPIRHCSMFNAHGAIELSVALQCDFCNDNHEHKPFLDTTHLIFIPLILRITNWLLS